MLVVKIPAGDRGYHRGLGWLLRGRGLGDDSTPDLATLLAESDNNQDSPISSSYPINEISAPNIVGTISPANIGTPSPAPPANTVLNAFGAAIPAAGYTVNLQGQVVPTSSLAGVGATLSNFVTQNKSLLLLSGMGIVGLSLFRGKKKR